MGGARDAEPVKECGSRVALYVKQERREFIGLEGWIGQWRGVGNESLGQVCTIQIMIRHRAESDIGHGALCQDPCISSRATAPSSAILARLNSSLYGYPEKGTSKFPLKHYNSTRRKQKRRKMVSARAKFFCQIQRLADLRPQVRTLQLPIPLPRHHPARLHLYLRARRGSRSPRP